MFVKKVVLFDAIIFSIEKTLTKSPVVYTYIESFIIQAGQNCFLKENVFGTKPVRKKTLCLVRNNFFRGLTIECTLFRYKNFQFINIENKQSNGVPSSGTPIDTTKNTRLFYNTICALGFTRGGNGIKMSDSEGNHYFLVFDLSSSGEAGEDLTLFPELAGAGFTMNLTFTEILTHPVELLPVGKRFCQIFIDATRNISKTVSSMDNVTLAELAQTRCSSSTAKFGRVWSIENYELLFSLPLQRQTFTKQQNKQEKSKNDSFRSLKLVSL